MKHTRVHIDLLVVRHEPDLGVIHGIKFTKQSTLVIDNERLDRRPNESVSVSIRSNAAGYSNYQVSKIPRTRPRATAYQILGALVCSLGASSLIVGGAAATLGPAVAGPAIAGPAPQL